MKEIIGDRWEESLDDQEWKRTCKGIFLEALECFIKGEEPEREIYTKRRQIQEEIIRSLEDVDGVQEEATSSSMFSFYFC